ncbi:hypothetical protein BASA50_010604 [Batrachochytrium salamandrivorans]|uniref:LYR motif-containing protein 2 n=1 Tax=Batrachochytrium salamandrivorans TaxID=1357716 RepID=A0ABQ8EY07_9FUNG|nr:hypothetical protein BASA62_010062 [Batrachochytrium salamandrivorans]KAH6577146.1 hypothetical protein BASA60_004225 [Batrachochytrium salamandrivorans]KAH6588643.1 hypothetical protein BASA50_010604 [Batrachochytrium salamandrivorans]KAH6602290.1 hypothetical protein BASA61_001243 [Batrachochytrium salamandrivorans]KAH9249506.1 hypothetical protein BASA81_012770 [Batrachochytrium salamandrivorans]
MTRSRVLQLYRDILRTTKYVAKIDKDYICSWARSDFERYRNESSQEKIEMLLSQGKVQLRTLENSVTLSKRRYNS